MLFTLHVARHNLLKEFYSIYRFIVSVTEWPRWNKEKPFLTNFVKLIRYGVSILDDSVQNHDWWEQADIMKQRCFYLDYNTNGIADRI
jgi:hypothetical protein